MMEKRTLAHVLVRPGVTDLLHRLDAAACIYGPGGELLYGPQPPAQEAGRNASEVYLGERVLGRVHSERSDDLAALLGHLARESEKSLEARREEDQYREVILALSSELNLDRLLALIMDATTRLLDAERSTLFLHDAANAELWSPVAQGVKGGVIRIPENAGIAGQVLTSGQAVNLPEAYNDPRFDPETDRRTGYRTRSLLCCPVVNKQGRVIGVTQVLNKRGGPFTDRDAKRLSGFSAQAAIAIENARLYNHMEELVRDRTHDLNAALELLSGELETAAEYVRRLLPQPELAGGLRFDWRYAPSSSLGGDAFGYHELDAERLAVYLIDVSGHGVGAALLSVSILNLLRSHLLHDADFLDPAQVLAALNQAFPMDEHNGMFFTMWYGVYDRTTRRLTYAGAGHPPALLLSGSATRRLFTHNMLLGGMPAQKYVTESLEIEPGARLLVYSDGVYEIRRPDQTMWTFEEFEKYMTTPGRSGARPGLDALMAHTQTLAGRQGWEDDFSILEVVFGPAD